MIAFFVISGFVIHYPYVHGKEFDTIEFYIRRYIRIAGPLLAAMLAARMVNVELGIFQTSILWSLIAELIYYTLYPLVKWVLGKVGWNVLMPATFLSAYLVVSSDPQAGNYPSYGISMNWILGLPCWLLGVRLAETRWHSITNRVALKTINVWRLSIFLASVLCSVLRFHSPIGYPWTLNIFSIAVYFWLKNEILYWNGSDTAAVNWLERSGSWSYSLYLTHTLSQKLFRSFLGSDRSGSVFTWIFEMSFILLGAYLFFLLFERTSHHFARKVARGHLRRVTIQS